MPWEMAAVRTLFVLIVISPPYHLRPFQLGALNSILLGAVLALTFVFFEMRLERASLKRLIGAAVGSTLGILAALMMSHLLSVTSVDKGLLSFIQVTLLLLMAYVGLVLGATKGDLLNLSALGGLFTAERQSKRSCKILDTSVIIDGRIVDICERSEERRVGKECRSR